MLSRISFISLAAIFNAALMIGLPGVASATTPGPTPCPVRFPDLFERNADELERVIRSDSGEDERQCAFESLRRLVPDVLPLIKLLKSPKAELRAQAAEEIPHYGDAAVNAIPALLRALDDDDERVRASAAQALGGIPHRSPRVIDKLIEKLSDPSQRVVENSARALSNSGLLPEKALAPLLKALQRPNICCIVAAISQVQSPQTLPALVELLKSPKAELRAQAAEEIPRTGYAAAKAIPALLLALDDDDERVRANAAQAFGGINHGSPWVIDKLIERLSDPSERVAENSGWALSQSGFLPEKALAPLLKALQRQNCCVVLAISQVQSPQTLPALVELLTGPNEDARLFASLAVPAYGNAALPLLQRKMRFSRDPAMRKYISDAIEGAKLTGANPLLVEFYATDMKALARQARDPSPEKRMVAMQRYEHLLPAMSLDIDSNLLVRVAQCDPVPEIRASAVRMLNTIAKSFPDIREVAGTSEYVRNPPQPDSGVCRDWRQ